MQNTWLTIAGGPSSNVKDDVLYIDDTCRSNYGLSIAENMYI